MEVGATAQLPGVLAGCLSEFCLWGRAGTGCAGASCAAGAASNPQNVGLHAVRKQELLDPGQLQ
jgi:hypothetical protein